MIISKSTLYVGFVGAVLLVVGADFNLASAQSKSTNKEGADCVPVASWVVPAGKKMANNEVIGRAAKQSVVLLGEMHDNLEHHRWQLQMLAALYTSRPDMVIGFEMFPRRVQKALDRWVAGEFSETEFLAAADWDSVWSTDASYYLPLFHFARMNRIPMVALNVDTRLRREISAKSFDGVPESEREGVTRPASPSVAYLDYLLPIYREHEREGKKKTEIGHDDPDFRRFIESQQLWDRAMAQAIHRSLERPGRPLVVGIMGAGHIKHGYGVPHQLKDLKVLDVAMLLPWDSGKACGQLVAGMADAVFGVAPFVSSVQQHQRLGIRFEIASDGGARVLQVEKGSIAEISGLRNGDVILEVADMVVKQTGDVVAAVKRHAPGTWLPLKVKRGNETIEVIAKFPAEER